MTLYVRRSTPVTPAAAPLTMAAPTLTVGNTQLTASFVAPYSDATITGYDIRRSVQSANSWTTYTAVTTIVEPVTLVSLTNSTAYEVQVRATSAAGTGEWSPSGVATPTAATFGYRSITTAVTPAGTSMNVPAGAVTGDTLIFIASRDFDIGGTPLAPSGATAVGTPTDQTGGYPSFMVWRILSWNGSTTTYDFGMSGGWAGERVIICIDGTASAVTAGTYTSGGGAAFTWTGMTMSTGDLAIAIGGAYDSADTPVTNFDTAFTLRYGQTFGEWAGMSVWTDLVASGGTISPSPAGTIGLGGNYGSLLVRVQP